MTLAQLITMTRELIDEPQSTASLTDTTVTRFLNGRYNDVNNRIIDINESYFGAIDETVDLVSGTDNYALPALDANSRTKITRIKRIEIAYDGTNFISAMPIPIQELPDSNYTSSVYTTQNPRYYMLGNSVYLLPAPSANATNAMKIWYVSRQPELENDSDIPAFQDSYHQILAYGAAADIKLREGSRVLDTDDLGYVDRFEGKFSEGLRSLLSTIQPRDISAPVVVSIVRDFNNIDNENSALPGSLTP